MSEGGGADFDVTLEVRPVGYAEGLDTASAANTSFAESTDQVSNSSRRAQTASDDLVAAERRRMQSAAELARYYREQISLLAQYQERLAATGGAGPSAPAAGPQTPISPVESTGINPQMGASIDALIAREQDLRAAIRSLGTEITDVDQVTSNVSALRERTLEMLGQVEAARQGEAAERAYAEAMELRKAVAATGAAPGSSGAAAAETELQAQERLRAELQAIAAARELDSRAAAQEEEAQRRLSSTLSSLRSSANQTEQMVSAERQGAQAVAVLNQQLQLRNALLQAGVAEISAQGELVITSEAGAIAIQTEVEALQRQQAALVEVRAANLDAADSGIWGVLSEAIGEVLQALKQIVVYGGLFVLGAKIKEAVQSAFEFEASLTRLRTLVGTTVAEVDRIRAAIVGVSLATGQSADDNAKAMFAIESSGLRGEQALRALQASAMGAAIGLGDQTTVARAAVSAMVAYGAQNLSAKDALDVLIATAREGNTSVDDLAGSFGRVTGIAASVGVKFGDLGAAVASFTRVGVSAQEAVTGLRGVLSALDLKEAKSAEAALRSVGLSVAGLRQEIKEKGLAEALVDLVAHFNGDNDELAKVIPNIRALAEVLSNAKSQAGEYLGIQERVNAAIGHATDEAFALEQKDPAFVWRQMQAALDEVGRTIGEDVLPTFAKLAADIRDAVQDGALAGWARVISIALDGVVLAGRGAGLIFGQMPLILGVLIFALLSSTTAASAFGTAVTWVGVQLIDLQAVIAANPLGAFAVAILVVVSALNYLAQQQAKVDQAWLNDNARINEDAVALHNLEGQYYRVIDARAKMVGPTQPGKGSTMSGPSAVADTRFTTTHVELRTDAGSFLGELAAIQERYAAASVAANGNRVAVEAAKIAHDRETSALQANTQAQLDNMKAVSARQEAMAKSTAAELDNASRQLAAAQRAAQGHGPTTSFQLAGETWTKPDPVFAAAQAAALKVQELKNNLKLYSDQAKTGTEVETKLQAALDRSKVATEQHSAATEKGSKSAANFHLELSNLLKVRQQEIEDAHSMAAAELLGGVAVQEATAQAAANKLVVEEQGKALKAKTSLTKEEEASIRSKVAAMALENQAVAVNAQLYQSRLAGQNAQLSGWAKLQDAISGTSSAGQRMTAVLGVEAFAEQKGLSLGADKIQQLRDEALAQVDRASALQTVLAQVDQDRQFTLDLRDAEAAYGDALSRSNDASREAAVQKKILAALKADGIAAGAKEAAIEEAVVRAQQLDIDRTKAGTVATVARTKALDDLNREQAKYADLASVRKSNEAVGTAITQVLSQYGLLSKATDELSLKERARAEFAAEMGQRSLAAITAELRGQDEEKRKLAENAAAYDIYKLKVDDFLTSLSSAFDLLSAGLGGSSTSMGRLAADMGKLVVAIQAVADAQGKANKVMAAAQVVAGLGAALASLNVGGSGKTGGPQALGGKLDGNYAGIGSIVGIIVGAVVGYFTAGVGTGAGAAIGTALGGVLGSMISKAGDSASAQLRAGGNIIVGESSKQLDGAVSDALRKIFQGLQAVFASLGLLFQGAPLIDIKVRDNIVRVIVGNVVRTFSSMSDAISFAIAEALKQTATGGHLPPEVIAALKHTTATDMQSLQSDIDFAFSIANVGVPKVVQAIDKSVSDFYVSMQRAVSLGIDTAKVVQQFAIQIQAQKDSILGTPGKSPAEQMRADAAAFNQKMDLLKAQEQADLADLAIKRTDLEAKLALLKLSGTLTKDQLQQIADAQAALGAIDSAILAAQGVIDSIVKISDSELAAALARLGKGGGGGGKSGPSPLEQMILDANKATRQSGMTDFGRQLDDLQTKWRDAIAAVHLHSNALEEAKKKHDAAIVAAHGNADAIKAANAEYAKETAGIAKTQAALAAANAARQQEIDLLKKDLDARVKTFTSVGKPGGDITSQLAGVDSQAKGLIDDARALYHAGGMTLQQLHQTTAAIRAADAAQKQVITSGVLKTVSDFLGGKGATGLLGNLAGISDQAKGLTDNLQALADAGQISQAQLKGLSDQIVAQAKRLQDAAITSTSQGLLSDLYGYLGMDKEAAQQKFEITMAELAARRAELAAAMQTAHYSQEAMDAILGPIDKLIARVQAAGPSIFGNNNQPASDGLTQAQRIAQDQAMFVNGQYVGPNGAAAGGTAASPEAALLAQYQAAHIAAGQTTYQQEIQKVNDDFAKIRAVLGNTVAVQQAYASALRDVIVKTLKPVQDLYNSLNQSALSPLRPIEKLQDAQRQFEAAAAAIQAGDLSNLDQFATLAQNYLTQAQAALPQGSEAYTAIFDQVQHLLGQVLAQYGVQAQPPVPPGGSPVPGAPPTGPGGTPPTVNVQPVVDAVASSAGDQLVELRAIKANTANTTSEVYQLRQRLDRPVTVFETVS